MDLVNAVTQITLESLVANKTNQVLNLAKNKNKSNKRIKRPMPRKVMTIPHNHKGILKTSMLKVSRPTFRKKETSSLNLYLRVIMITIIYQKKRS